MLSVYKTKQFARFARKARIGDSQLWKVAQEINEGHIDADLGGGVIKQRIARAGQGKSGGSRSIVAFRLQHRAIFVYGFEKKDLGNISAIDLFAYRKLAASLLGCSEEELAQIVMEGNLIEVNSSEGETDGKENL